MLCTAALALPSDLVGPTRVVSWFVPLDPASVAIGFGFLDRYRSTAGHSEERPDKPRTRGESR